jgi:hypothetical protein
MPRGDGTGPDGLGPGTGRGKGGGSEFVPNSSFQNLPLGGHFSLLPPCLSEIGWIKSSLKEKQGTNLSKMNLNSENNFNFF